MHLSDDGLISFNFRFSALNSDHITPSFKSSQAFTKQILEQSRSIGLVLNVITCSETGIIKSQHLSQ